jgi:Right handed beta helix region
LQHAIPQVLSRNQSRSYRSGQWWDPASQSRWSVRLSRTRFERVSADIGAATRAVVVEALMPLTMLSVCGAATPASAGVADVPCPVGAIVVEPGASIQAAVDHAGDGAAFCLKNGVHRVQVVRPKPGQGFYGEGQTILNGSRLLATFRREGRYWVATWQGPYGPRRGDCASNTPACNLPEGLFIDDEPLQPVLSKDSIQPGQFHVDRTGERVYVVDDPSGRKVEATVATVAFDGTAPFVRINNLTIEKYATVAQKGAIQAQTKAALGWTLENCELRLNSAAGIAVGNGTRVQDCDIHDNGQIGITGAGNGVLIENNRVWANNTRGFRFRWEAGGVKLAASDGVTFRGNHVYNNDGPGLWCDINCRNVLYEHNLIEHNQGAGLFHEISYHAVIRNNALRHNGIDGKAWFWGVNILIAASENVDVYGNVLTVSAGGCGIVLADQSRPIEGGGMPGKYKTRNNMVRDNEMTFEGAGCAGGASDVEPGDENYSIIEAGNNRFDRNVYRVPRMSGALRFEWGHVILDWDGLRHRGLEPNGKLVIY